MDVDRVVCETAGALGLCDVAITVDLVMPSARSRRSKREGLSRADLTVVVVNASDPARPPRSLLTADTGRCLLPYGHCVYQGGTWLGGYGAATALDADRLGRDAPDRGAYALDLIRRYDGLIEAFGDHSADTDQIGGES